MNCLFSIVFSLIVSTCAVDCLELEIHW